MNYWLYNQRRLNRPDRRFPEVGPKSYPVPHNLLDKNPRRSRKKFEKWYKLPGAAHALYWKTHPEYRS